ncbi:MAG: methyl-accepting chemotaxis protein, partial [Chromatiales bacterium]|nr:methyl-accepting chemotaxis protein [Chromatiales bacterium]
MLKQLTIRNVFLLLIALIAILSFTLLGFQMQMTSVVKDSFDTYIDTAVKRNDLLFEIREAVGYGGAIHQFKNYVLRGKDKQYAAFNQRYESLSKTLRAYKALPDITTKERQAIDDIAEVFAKYRRALDSVKSHVANGLPPREIDNLVKISDGPAVKGLTTLQAHFTYLTDKERTLLANGIADIEHGMLLWVIGFSVIMTGLLITFSRRILLPLNEAVLAMHEVAEGDGDLSRRLAVHGQDEVAELAKGFNQFSDKISELVSKVRATSRQLGESTSRLTTASNNAKDSVEDQQYALEQTLQEISTLNTTVHNVAQHAVEASENTTSANQKASAGRQVINETIESINTLAGQVNKTSQVIMQLQHDSEQIGSVLDVIRGIAEQTNLLALNAAIEAARAGEQGRGFAVVADEVRTLASRTQESTQAIRHMIEQLQGGAVEAVDVMETSKSYGESSVEQIAEAGRVLVEIDEVIDGISLLNAQIAKVCNLDIFIMCLLKLKINAKRRNQTDNLFTKSSCHALSVSKR